MLFEFTVCGSVWPLFVDVVREKRSFRVVICLFLERFVCAGLRGNKDVTSEKSFSRGKVLDVGISCGFFDELNRTDYGYLVVVVLCSIDS